MNPVGVPPYEPHHSIIDCCSTEAFTVFQMNILSAISRISTDQKIEEAIAEFRYLLRTIIVIPSKRGHEHLTVATSASVKSD